MCGLLCYLDYVCKDRPFYTCGSVGTSNTKTYMTTKTKNGSKRYIWSYMMGKDSCPKDSQPMHKS